MRNLWFIAPAFLALSISAAAAQDAAPRADVPTSVYLINDLKITRAVVDAGSGAPSQAAFDIENRGRVTERLVGVTMDRAQAVHMATVEKDQAPHEVATLDIAPGRTVSVRLAAEAAPAPDQPALRAGDRLRGRLSFARAGVLDVSFRVAPAAPAAR